MKPSLASQLARKRTHRPEPKPFSAGEARAKLRGEQFLAEAHHYARSADPEMAVRCCIVAVRQTFGIARYLMVRDQIDDLLARIDPLQLIRRRLYGARQMAAIPTTALLISSAWVPPHASGLTRKIKAETPTQLLRPQLYSCR